MSKSHRFANRLIFSGIAMAACLLLAPQLCRAESDRSAATTQPSLHHEMEAMNHALTKLNRIVRNASRQAEALELVQELEKHTILAKGIAPPAATTRPAEERPAYLAQYRQQMRKLLNSELKLEQEISDNQSDKAVQSIKEIRRLEQIGHADFRPPRH